MEDMPLIGEDVLSEATLLLRMTRDDESAFASIYREYHPALYHYILRFCKIPSLAEDLVHDVFLKVWEIRHRINPELSFTGYLYRIARNHVFKTLGRLANDQALRKQLSWHLDESTHEQPEQVVRSREYDRLFNEALFRMPHQRRNVFCLCRQEGKSYDEAAAILHISRNAVKKHMVLSMRFICDYIVRYSGVLLIFCMAGNFLTFFCG